LEFIWRLSHTTYFGTNPNQAGSDKQLIQVHYFCHPLYGKKVAIIAQAKRANDHFYIISFFDNSKVYLPTWMTDPLVCQQFCVEQEPSCSLTALQSLREYLDCF
jgi:hypothetical protein